MKIRSLGQWLFAYLPIRFTVPFLALMAWYLFYIWPWLFELFYPDQYGSALSDALGEFIDTHIKPRWVQTLNLEPAADALGVLILLLAGVLVFYNVAALLYQLIR